MADPPAESPIVPPQRPRSTLVASFRYAFRGVGWTVVRERNMRLHVVAAIGVVIAGIVRRVEPAEWALLAIAIAGVWTAELINTAIEATVDLACPQPHHLARHAKDAAAGAVLVAAIAAVVIGVIVFV